MNGKLKKNVLYLTALQFFNYAAPLILVPYLIFLLGTEKYGLIAVILGITQFCYVITEFGFAQSSTAKIAENVNDKENVALINGAVIIIKIILSLICAIMSALFILYQGYGGGILLLGVMLIILSQALQPIWFFNGIEDMGKITAFTLLSKSLYFILSVIGLLFLKDINIVIYSMAISTTVGTALSYILLYRTGYNILLPGITILVEEFRFARQFFWARGAVSLYTSLCTIIVGAAGGIQSAALFSVCEQIYKAGKALTAPLCQALYPYLIRTKDWKVFFKFFTITSLVMFLGCIFVMLISKFILNTIFHVDARESVTTLKILSITVFISFLGVYFGHLALVPLNKIKVANNSVLVGAFFFVIVNLVLYQFNLISPISMAGVIFLTELIITLIRVIAFYIAYQAEKNKCQM
ncbi:oligosaccharide flippase family protein [Pseudocitrobacter vendiensis]|uniref:Putative O-antigen transporter n=1 Tax=Pseudocitrobacter vendiensis TaxID=2488306 RepID=A0ABN8T8I8_9ENTR|nr:oligosaccharide flippase family protein [Pseudocitrobacter vendiensis]CAH6636744.1 hypothetical protein FBBNIHIM_07940 [Pseudocitrobacter vendiensis]